MLITTIIPTYRRPTDLARCLTALHNQIRLADEVLVVVRDTDTATWEFLASYHPSMPLRILTVTIPGVVAALNTALEIASGEIVTFTDDDAAPHPDWLQRIEAHFLADASLGGLGGRDWRYDGTTLLQEPERDQVGQLQWFGRMVGNHHVGVGKPRSIDILKGVNMSYRRAAIEHLRFDTRLLGTGAQVHNEMAFSLEVKRRGWKLLYDPAVAVDHFEGSRFEEDRVGNFDSTKLAVFNSSYNEALILLEHLPVTRRMVYLIWSLLIGTRQAPGLLQALRFTASFGTTAWRRFWVTQRGKFSALAARRNQQQHDPQLRDAMPS